MLGEKEEHLRQGGTNAGPGDNVIWASRVTEGPRLPDGALEGLARAALGLHSKNPQTDSVPHFSPKSHKCQQNTAASQICSIRVTPNTQAVMVC